MILLRAKPCSYEDRLLSIAMTNEALAPPGDNGFLRSLSREGLSLVQPHLEFIALPVPNVIHKGENPHSLSIS